MRNTCEHPYTYFVFVFGAEIVFVCVCEHLQSAFQKRNIAPHDLRPPRPFLLASQRWQAFFPFKALTIVANGQPGAPIGNKNAIKNRPITDLIRRALLQNDSEKARKLADELVKRAIEGSDRAAVEVLDRIEGKVEQPLSAQIDANVTVNIVRFGAGNTP